VTGTEIVTVTASQKCDIRVRLDLHWASCFFIEFYDANRKAVTMADQAELIFARTFVKTIAGQPVTFHDDYQQPLQDWSRKIPILPVSICDGSMQRCSVHHSHDTLD